MAPSLQAEMLLAQNVVLDREELGNSSRNRLWDLTEPCKTLRHLLLDLDLAALHNKRPTSVPFPLASLESFNGQYSNFEHVHLRQNACILNEAREAILENVAQTLLFHADSLTGELNADDFAVALPVIKKLFCSSAPTGYEPMPKPEVVSIDEPLEANRWIKGEVLLQDRTIQGGWVNTTITHTGMMIFVQDLDRQQMYAIMAYTLPGQDKDDDRVAAKEGEQGTSEQPAKKKTKYQAKILLALSPSCYVTAPGSKLVHGPKLSQRRGTRDVLRTDSLFDMVSNNPYRYKARLARLDSVLLDEWKFSVMEALPLRKQEALVNPRPQIQSIPFSNMPVAQGNELYDSFYAIIRPFCMVALEPQQVLFIMEFILLLYRQSTSASIEEFLKLNGPPGTGKTLTLSHGVVLTKTDKVVRSTLSLLQRHQLIQFTYIDLEVERIIGQRITVSAITNKAVDAAAIAIDEVVRHNRSDGLRVVRVSEVRKAHKHPELFRLHATYRRAEAQLRDVKEEFYQLIARINELEDVREEENEAKKSANADSEQTVGPLGLQERARDEALLETARSRGEPAPEELTTGEKINKMHHKKVLLDQHITWLQEKMTVPAVRRARRNLNKQQMDKEKAYSVSLAKHNPDFNTNQTNIFCFTVGFANTYHPDVLGSVAGSINILDEASQCGSADFAVLLSRAKSIVFCGDIHQLGTLLRGGVEGNEDLRESVMKRVRDRDVALKICFRLPVDMTRLLSDNIYVSDGLYSPAGQRILKSSALHHLRLFSPYTILNVPEGRTDNAQGGNSKVNREEVDAIHAYLLVLAQQIIGLGLKPVNVAVISPYSAQAELLDDCCTPDFSDCPAFSSFVVGTIDIIQGQTTGITVMSCVRAPMRAGYGGSVNTEFLTEERLNVALSRAKGNLVLVMNLPAITAGFSQHPNPLLQNLLVQLGAVRITLSGPPAQILATLRTEASTLLPDPLQNEYATSPCNAPAETTSKWLYNGQAESLQASLPGIASYIRKEMAELKM